MRSGCEARPLWGDGGASDGDPLVPRRDWLAFGLLGVGAAVWPSGPASWEMRRSVGFS
jgi:hypothetical protein